MRIFDSLDSRGSLCHPRENGDPVLDSRMRGNDNNAACSMRWNSDLSENIL
jgi:hypothetical protein